MSRKNESSSGGVAGFQLPLGSEEEAVRSFVKKKVQEIVRKKKGGGGFILYKPNAGKKGPAKAVGEFPTKTLAKQAELMRFPPRDPKKLKNAKKEVDAMRKRKRKSESLDRLRDRLFEAAADTLDRLEDPDAEKVDAGQVDQPAEEPTQTTVQDAPPPTPTEKEPSREDESRWEELLSSVSQDAIKRDSRLRSLHQKMENQAIKALEKTVKSLSSQISYKVGKGKTGRDRMGRPYIAATIQTDSGKVGPIYMYVRGDLLHVVSNGDVKSDIMKLDPESAKEIKDALAELPNRFDGSKIKDAIEQRDAYLATIEGEMDDFLSDLDGLEMTVIKRLMADKYAGGSK